MLWYQWRTLQNLPGMGRGSDWHWLEVGLYYQQYRVEDCQWGVVIYSWSDWDKPTPSRKIIILSKTFLTIITKSQSSFSTRRESHPTVQHSPGYYHLFSDTSEDMHITKLSLIDVVFRDSVLDYLGVRIIDMSSSEISVSSRVVQFSLTRSYLNL